MSENEWGSGCPDCHWTTRDEGYATRREAMHTYHQHRDRDHKEQP